MTQDYCLSPLPHADAEIHPTMGRDFQHWQMLHQLWNAAKEDPTAKVDLECKLDDTPFECWCGEKGKYHELCDVSGLASCCGGLGTLDCYCGGDQCVCHHHGAIECPGCPDCEGDEACEQEGDYAD